MSNWRTTVRAVLALALLAMGPPAKAAPTDLCRLLFVPDGYGLTCAGRAGSAGSDWRVVVEPEEGVFAALSELSLEPVEEPIEDPEAWLRDQVRFDLSGFESAVHELAASDDSPFVEEQFAESLKAWLGLVTSFAEMPLQGCTEPTLSGDVRELACQWHIGPFRQHLLTRLVARDDQLYVIRIRAMNERRLRHLVAIANSF